MGFGVWGTGFRVQGSGLGFGVQVLKAHNSGCRVQGSGLKVSGSGVRVHGSGWRVSGRGLRNEDSGSKVSTVWSHHGLPHTE